jgi:phosphoribosylaminoimidazole carboxylase PurE protein
MGSDSDLAIMKEAKEILDSFGIPNEITIFSAHRTARRMIDYAINAKDRGIKVIIAGAGGAAHLPGMIASLTPIPVIGVPIKTRNLEGLDSLLSIVQMPPGVPVATVAINGGRNAGILASQILGIESVDIVRKVEQYKQDLETTVLRKADLLEKTDPEKYLKLVEK